MPSEPAAVLNMLSDQVKKSRIRCPLCGSSIPARGIRARPLVDNPRWEVLYSCSTCGLLTNFDTEAVSIRYLQTTHGSRWAKKLRQFYHQNARRYHEQATPFHQFSVFVIGFLTWMVLIGNLNPIEVLWGLVVSLIVARLIYRFVAFNLPGWIFSPRRWVYFIELVIEFVRQIVVQNVTLSWRVLQPKLPIKPGIVAIPTYLRDNVELTILGSLMSLTPDTVTIDVDPEEGIIYVHWIDVQTTDPAEAQLLISSELESRISRWLR